RNRRVAVKAGEEAQEKSAIGNIAGDRARHRQREPAPACGHIGKAARGKADTQQIAKSWRVGEWATQVSAVWQPNPSASQCHRTAASAATTGLAQVIRISRGTKHWIESLRTQAEFGGIGLANDDCSGFLFALDDQAVKIGYVVLVQGRAKRC